MRQFNFTVRANRPPLPWQIRAAMQLQVDPAIPQRGDRLRFYWHPPGRPQLQLGYGTCKSADAARFYRDSEGRMRMSVEGMPLLDREIEEIARDAGYSSPAAFFRYFESTYGLPFNGVLLRW